jgi:tetratricopeptide (TPR) repeat protein
MRNLRLILRTLAGAASITTVVGCHQPAPEPRTIVTPTAAPTVTKTEAPKIDLGAPIAASEPSAPVTIAEETDPSPNQLVKDARDALAVGELDRALKLARLAVVEAPGKSAAWNTLGRVQLRRGERDAALDSFEQAVETNPASSWARNNHGLALLYAERYDESIDELEQATDLSPSVGLMWNNLGMAYEHADRLEEARSAYRRAISLDHRGATENFVRIEGVKRLGHVAKADIPTTPDPDSDHEEVIDRGL